MTTNLTTVRLTHDGAPYDPGRAFPGPLPPRLRAARPIRRRRRPMSRRRRYTVRLTVPRIDALIGADR